MSFKSWIEKTYQDKLTIKRYTTVDNPDGTTGDAQDKSAELIDIPCRISSLKQDERDRVNWEVDEVEARVMIFLSPDIRVKKGDEVVVSKCINGVEVNSYKGYAGDPMVYDLAQQFILFEKRVKTNGL